MLETSPGARMSLDLNSPAAMHFDKKGNISTVINSETEQTRQRGSQRSLKAAFWRCMFLSVCEHVQRNMYVHVCITEREKGEYSGGMLVMSV